MKFTRPTNRAEPLQLGQPVYSWKEGIPINVVDAERGILGCAHTKERLTPKR